MNIKLKVKNSVFIAAILSSIGVASAQDLRFRNPGPNQLIPSPSSLEIKKGWDGVPTMPTGDDHEPWLNFIRHWRDERRIRVGYSGSRYDMPELKWTQTSFLQPQVMVEERYLYDPVSHRYTVDRYLDDLTKRYGGIDSVLIWPTYPNIGVDDRNQHDLIRSMPGGVPGVRQMIADFHRRGVRVLFPMMMWDQGTRDPGSPWPEAIAKLMSEIGADGINGDTQDGVPLAFSVAADKIGHPLAFEPEGSPSDEALAWNLMTWGQYQYGFVPMVDKYKLLEPRHMVHISDRWKRDKTDNLQFAFFNGVGWESWENIWGIWNGINPRDAEIVRRIMTIERAVAPFLTSVDWEPLAPTIQFGVFASRWKLGQETVWTIVNRNEYDVAGTQIELPVEQEGMHYFDIYHGAELTNTENREGRVSLSFKIEAHGYGALLASRNPLGPGIKGLMSSMSLLSAKPLGDYSHEWTVLPQQIVPISAAKTTTASPQGMVLIPAGTFEFRVMGIELEGSDDIGVDVQYPWEASPRRFHCHSLPLGSFWIDKYPVTNAQFRQFLDATQYHPQDDLNFLHDWTNGNYPKDWDKKPVTWVSLEDARAYAAWAGKRLPHEWEWQYAAQSADGRAYPWGESWNPAAVPVPDKSRTNRGPDAVDAHPKGVSPFGVMDLVGNVWQWTEEFQDEHTRAGILRGGSYYQPQNSVWYFPQAYKLSEHGKLLLMAPSKDRSGCIGFRCASDVE